MDDQVIKDAQFRKGLSIAFFNATNNAIELARLSATAEAGDTDSIKQRVAYWRDWLLEEHGKYYAEVIARIGSHFSVDEAIEKLRATTTIESLAAVWRGISADERAHPDIISVKDELKKKYEEAR